jgi:hypothetical protein
VTAPAAAPGRHCRTDAPWRRRVGSTRPNRGAEGVGGVPAWWRAVPAGCAPARSQGGWLSAALGAIEDADLRTDAETALRALVWLLARCADWRTPLLTRPTWAVLMTGTGRRRSWLAARLAWLRERGLLAVLEHGSTPATRAGPLAGLAGNRAAVYLLTTPLPRSVDISGPVGEPTPEAGEAVPAAAVEITEALPVEERWTPPKSRRDCVEPLHARASEEEGSLRSPGQKQAPKREGRAPARAGTARAGRCEAARALQQRVRAARALSAVHVAALVRVFLAAGWSVSDLVYATDHAPDGAAHWHTAPVHSPAGWLAARLGWWTDAAGAVRPSHTAQLAAAATAHRRRLAGQRAAAEAAAGSAATPAQRREHLAAIRATLAERRRPA